MAVIIILIILSVQELSLDTTKEGPRAERVKSLLLRMK